MKTNVPSGAAWLGGSGALPFIALAGATPFLSGSRRLFVVHALVTYGAIILSFLGGVHWGLAMAQGPGPGRASVSSRLVISVIPSLAGWAALLLPDRTSLLMLAVSVAAMLWIDLLATRRGEAPPWYPKLRIPLTIAVVASLMTGALA